MSHPLGGTSSTGPHSIVSIHHTVHSIVDNTKPDTRGNRESIAVPTVDEHCVLGEVVYTVSRKNAYVCVCVVLYVQPTEMGFS